MLLQTLLSLSAVLSRVAAIPISSPENVIRQRDNTTVGITQSLLDDFQLFANFTSASYCLNNQNSSGSLITCPATVCPLVEADDVTSIIEFGGDNDTTFADVQGYVALDPVRSLIVVAFSGSTTLRNWLTDFTFVEVAYTLTGCESCFVHAGFATGWSEQRTAVVGAVTSAFAANPDYSIVVTGHSLGAAIATLAAAELRTLSFGVDTYTFGSPRVGNEAFADFVTAQPGVNNRMTHFNDPVPQIPPTWVGYEHTSPEYWLSTGTGTTNDYTVEDVVVCEGVGNDGCNAGTGLIPIDGDAHNHYLGLIIACQGAFMV